MTAVAIAQINDEPTDFIHLSSGDLMHSLQAVQHRCTLPKRRNRGDRSKQLLRPLGYSVSRTP